MDIKSFLNEHGLNEIELDFIRNDRKRKNFVVEGQYHIYRFHVGLKLDYGWGEGVFASAHGETLDAAFLKVLRRMSPALREYRRDDLADIIEAL